MKVTITQSDGGESITTTVDTASVLRTVILAQVKPIEDVCMPRLEVDSEGAFALATTLVYVARCVVENAEHWHDSVGCPIGATDV